MTKNLKSYEYLHEVVLLPQQDTAQSSDRGPNLTMVSISNISGGQNAMMLTLQLKEVQKR